MERLGGVGVRGGWFGRGAESLVFVLFCFSGMLCRIVQMNDEAVNVKDNTQ